MRGIVPGLAGALIAAALNCAPPARANDSAGAPSHLTLDLTGGFESTSAFRGLRSRRLNPNPYLQLDFEISDAYLGLYGAPVAFGAETDALIYAYGGYAPTIAGFDLDIGIGVYAFPDSRIYEFDLDGDGVTDHSGRKGLIEPYAGLKRVVGPVELSVVAFASPNSLGDSGRAFYYRGEAEFALPEDFSFVAGYGASRFRDRLLNDDYDDWSVALKKSVLGFDLKLRYSDTVGAVGLDNRTLALVVERGFSLFSRETRRGRTPEKIRNRFTFDKCRLGAAR